MRKMKTGKMKSENFNNFNKYLEKRIRDTVEKYKLIKPGEKVAVALSGGKDSVLTLHILNELRKDFNFDLLAISIHEGISGYRREGLKIAEKNADDMGVELVKKFFKDEFGFGIDDISNLYKSACIPCGVLRRYLLNKTAYEIGASKIATGHNLDDEVQSFLMSFARADFRKFGKFGPKSRKIHPKLVPRIKPLWNIPEREVGIWAVLNNIGAHFAECPYSHMSLRSKTKDFLNKMESERPGTKLGILKSFEKTFKPEETSPELYECQKCGETSSLEVCKVCEMLDDIKKVI